MQITIERSPVETIPADALVLPVFEGAGDPRVEALLGDLAGSGEFTGKAFESTLIHRPQGYAARRVLLLGAGKPDKFDGLTARRLAAAALRALKPKGVKSIAFVAGANDVQGAAEGAVLGDFDADQFKSEKNGKAVETFAIAVPGGSGGLEAAAERGRIIAESQNLARSLANQPGNLLPPLALADRARAVAAEAGLEFELLDQDRMKQLGMGALLGVSLGSAQPPCLIILRYKPAGEASSKSHLGLVGKGVTFDSGGISIKPADGMEKMKYDMSGGAATIAAMRAIGMLKPSIAVTGLIPAVENMTGAKAQRPGDIVTALNGKTIEVINTDAEGRLILADALVYAQRIGCTHLVDAATLTGAIAVALGHIHAGAFGNDDAMLQRVLEAARSEGERAWHMPLDEDYEEYLKNPYADLSNVGGRYGGAVTAAWFLKEFADPLPWVHLDIAGTAWLDEGKAWSSKGPSGIPMRTFVHLAMNWKD